MGRKGYFQLCLFIVLALLSVTFADHEDLSDVIDDDNGQSYTKVLSRKKRFLTFPDGSSFQLVFCTQNHGYIQVGDVVYFANTAALAWELPKDPTFFNLFKKYEKGYDSLRRKDTNHVIFLNEDGRVISAKPYKRKFLVNPAMGKRSLDDQENAIKKLSVKEMHDKHENISYFKDLDEGSIEFHRQGRKSLYDKLETFIEAMGWRGKECVLRMLCDNKQTKSKQGTFFDEILKATFTLPDSSKGINDEYDIAHGGGDCEKRYPKCQNLHEQRAQ